MIRSYLDSGVILAFLTAKDSEYDAARTLLLHGAQRQFVVSPFVKLETIPHLRRDASPAYRVARDLLAAFESSDDLGSAMSWAFKVCLRVRLAGMDALHIGSAISANCDELITTERAAARKSIHGASRFIRVVHVSNAI